MIIFILITMILLLSLLLIYLVSRIKKFQIISKISKGRKWLSTLLIATPVLVIVIFGVFDVVNTIVVVLHILTFCFFFDIVGFVVKKTWHKESKYYWQGIAALVMTAIYLSFGWYNAHHVWQTDYTVETKKDLGMNKLRIVQISDSHIGATFDGNGFARHLNVIQKTNPDLVVVTGDFIDDDTTREDMIQGCEALGKIKTTYGIFLVWGNHDKGYFTKRSFSIDDLKAELKKNNVTILEDESVLIQDSFYVIGRQDRSQEGRESASDLTGNLDHSKYMIMLDHQPNDYDNEAKAGVDLVLSGHTHGGQLIPLDKIGLWTGANDAEYGMEVRGKTTFIVNSGISDWAMDYKTGTISEYGVVEIIKGK